MRYAAIQQCQAEFPVTRLCAVLKVSVSGYYAWLKRPAAPRQQANQQLQQTIRNIWQRVRGIYGAPRIHAELQASGNRVGHNRVARLMRVAGLRGKTVRRRRPVTTQTDPSHAVAPNRLARQFNVRHPNTVWLTDITYIETEEGFLYLAAVLDLASRQVVGLAMADHLRAELVEAALDMALIQRHPDQELLHHSDRGSQYTSHAYQHRLQVQGVTVSMSRAGQCLDNAPMESFWATLKRECADAPFPSRDLARSALFGYIMGFYNQHRRHSALGYLSPVMFEQQLKRNFNTPLN
jgi:transposase InsO family protein